MHVLFSTFKGTRIAQSVYSWCIGYTRGNYSILAGPKINFNTKHLKKGDPLPPYNGRLRVFNMRYCPYAERTILALNAKKIDYDIINVNLVDKPEWLSSVSPFEKVPSIEISEGVTVYESLVTAEYLDEVYPQRPLLPKDPYMRALDRVIAESIGPIQSLMLRIIRTPDQVTEEKIEAVRKSLGFLQNQLKGRGTTFLNGQEPGFADYMIWPWFERLILLKKYDAKADILPEFNLLNDYVQKMLKDPAVEAYSVPDDVWIQFFDNYRIGKPKYDMLDEK